MEKETNKLEIFNTNPHLKEYDRMIVNCYNDCWKAYREFTGTLDMAKLNIHFEEIVEKYGEFGQDLVFAFAGRVNHIKEYTKEEKK